MTTWIPPLIPASAGATIFDAHGRLLILRPSYKKGWTIPGGQLEPGESPWQGCRREVREETGLVVDRGRLACVDFRPPDRGVRFLFDCGALPAEALEAIAVDGFEITGHRFVDLAEAEELLRGPVRRRVLATVGAEHCLYLEDGRPVAGVR